MVVHHHPKSGLPGLKETLLVLGAAAGVFATSAGGAALIEAYSELAAWPWFVAAAYAGPGAVAFAVYWLIARRL